MKDEQPAITIEFKAIPVDVAPSEGERAKGTIGVGITPPSQTTEVVIRIKTAGGSVAAFLGGEEFLAFMRLLDQNAVIAIRREEDRAAGVIVVQ